MLLNCNCAKLAIFYRFLIMPRQVVFVDTVYMFLMVFMVCNYFVNTCVCDNMKNIYLILGASPVDKGHANDVSVCC